jgi:hypothetical protein
VRETAPPLIDIASENPFVNIHTDPRAAQIIACA